MSINTDQILKDILEIDEEDLEAMKTGGKYLVTTVPNGTVAVPGFLSQVSSGLLDINGLGLIPRFERPIAVVLVETMNLDGFDGPGLIKDVSDKIKKDLGYVIGNVYITNSALPLVSAIANLPMSYILANPNEAIKLKGKFTKEYTFKTLCERCYGVISKEIPQYKLISMALNSISKLPKDVSVVMLSEEFSGVVSGVNLEKEISNSRFCRLDLIDSSNDLPIKERVEKLKTSIENFLEEKVEVKI